MGGSVIGRTKEVFEYVRVGRRTLITGGETLRLKLQWRGNGYLEMYMYHSKNVVN